MVQRIEVTSDDGVRLAAWEYGGSEPDGAGGAHPNGQPGVLLLHGLMGRASTWANTARWLAPRFRVVTLDQRGHGCSDRPDGPYTREAYISDVETVIERLSLAPAVVIGHAMGALTAWQLALHRPELVRGLVVCDMRAAALGEASQHRWARWLESWPVPFDSLAAVHRWFAEDDPVLESAHPARGDYYVDLMDKGEDGYRPCFDFDHVLSSRAAWVQDAHWEELPLIHCPTLVVRGVDGELGRAEAQEMVRILSKGSYAEVPDAGHLVHYEQPEAWRQAVESFLHTFSEEP